MQKNREKLNKLFELAEGKVTILYASGTVSHNQTTHNFITNPGPTLHFHAQVKYFFIIHRFIASIIF